MRNYCVLIQYTSNTYKLRNKSFVVGSDTMGCWSSHGSPTVVIMKRMKVVTPYTRGYCFPRNNRTLSR